MMMVFTVMRTCIDMGSVGKGGVSREGDSRGEGGLACQRPAMTYLCICFNLYELETANTKLVHHS